jgi:phosphatidylglycerol:prolipoprotein diacylglycerol transferase
VWPVWARLELFGRPLMVTGYGVFAILGVAFGTYLCVRSARRLGFPVFDAFAAAALGAAFGLLGAKLMFLLVSLPRILEEGLAPFLAHGGLVWFGGLLGGAAAAIVYLRAYRLDVAGFADAVAPGLAAGHALGRIGCFMGGCCHGRPTGLPWGVTFPESPFFGGPVGQPLHPVQLYEAGAEALLALIAWRLAGRVPRGGAFLAWLGGYGAFRLAMELWVRGDDRGSGLLGWPPSALLSAAAIGVVLVSIWRWRRRSLTTETNVV